MAAPEERASELEQVVADARAVLDSLGRGWALVGGLAVSTRAEPRFTRVVDLAIAVAGDAEAEAVANHFQSLGYRILDVVEQEAAERLATVRLQPPGGDEHGAILDLLFASSGIEPEIVRHASMLEVFPGLELPVAGVSHLLAVKVLARNDEERPQDIADIRRLLERATPADVAAARQALSLIEERGFHRNRELLSELDSVL